MVRRVVDANIVIYAFIDNPKQEEAYRELTCLPPTAPDFLLVELSHVLTKYIRARKITSAEAQIICSEVPKIVDLIPMNGYINIALSEKHSTYDCLYLALALKENLSLLTADQSLAALAEKLGCGISRLR
jgi:predicted nucleic acid-binding protein